MSAYLGLDGHTYRERETGYFETEAEARAECERRGGRLWRERMQGAFYRADDGRTFRVNSRGWAPGFVIVEPVRSEA